MAAPNQQKEKKRIDPRQKELAEESLVRIAGRDVPGSKKVLAGLTKIKGVGWAISNLACKKLGIPKDKKIIELSKDEIKKIEEFLKNIDAPDYLKNRRNDPETGETKHFVGTDLEMKKDFDIRRMKKIRSYKGIRHTNKLPVRGQRTRSHFRKKGQAVSVQKKKK
jgi:small subunit ribosomal protein S13